MRPEEVFADGGVVKVNPSPHGGTWAYCHVVGGERVVEASGLLLPSDCGTDVVSNNQSEFFALLVALEAMPDGWSGTVYSDSGVTLQRFADPEAVKMKGIQDGWVQRLKAVRSRLGHLTFTLLGGHPNKKELEAGRRKDGKPVSPHNVWCDRECGRQSAGFTSTAIAG